MGCSFVISLLLFLGVHASDNLLTFPKNHHEFPIGVFYRARELQIHVAAYDRSWDVRKLYSEMGGIDPYEVFTCLCVACRVRRVILGREVGDQEGEQERQDSQDVNELVPVH